MTATYQEQRMLLTLQQEKEKFSLLVKHHIEIAENDTKNKGLAALAELLLCHCNEVLELSRKYVNLWHQLEENKLEQDKNR